MTFTIFFLILAIVNLLACMGVTFCYERIAELYRIDIRDVEFYNVMAALFGVVIWGALAIACIL